MLYGDPRDELFYPTLTPMIDSYSASTLIMSRPKEPLVSFLNKILELIYLMGINRIKYFHIIYCVIAISSPLLVQAYQEVN